MFGCLESTLLYVYHGKIQQSICSTLFIAKRL
jgi:hypothetical protein